MFRGQIARAREGRGHGVDINQTHGAQAVESVTRGQSHAIQNKLIRFREDDIGNLNVKQISLRAILMRIAAP